MGGIGSGRKPNPENFFKTAFLSTAKGEEIILPNMGGVKDAFAQSKLNLTTDDVSEGATNLYYTDARAKDAITRFASITVENPGSAEDLTIFFTPKAITISEMRAILVGSSTPSVTWTIRHHATDRSNAGNQVVTGGTTTTSTTSGSDVTSFNDATIPADSFIWLETTAQSGTVTELNVTLVYTED